MNVALQSRHFHHRGSLPYAVFVERFNLKIIRTALFHSGEVIFVGAVHQNIVVELVRRDAGINRITD